MWQISRPPCEWCELGQVFKWAIRKIGLLPNGPKWVDSKIIAETINDVHKLCAQQGSFHSYNNDIHPK